MKRILLKTLLNYLLILTAAMFMGSSLFAQGGPAQSPGFVPNRVIVKFKSEAAARGATQFKNELRTALRVSKTKRLNLINAEVWDFSGMSVQDALLKWKNDPRIQYIEPDYTVHASIVPNDPKLGDLWGMAKIQAPQAWDIITGGSLVIGVIDTGVDYLHPDLAANIWTNPGEIPGNGIDDDGNGYIDDVHGYDFVNNDGDPMDDNNHGTHCSGTIAGSGNNGIGVVGVNWTAKIMALKFLGAGGTGNTSDAILAIEYATQMGAKLTSNSWGGGGYSQAEYDAIQAAGAANTLFIAAAGNNNTDFISYPAGYDLDNVISVAATDQNDLRASFSNYSSTWVDLGAPGVGIWSTTRNNTYSSFDGTSMACPHVSGAAALIWARFPSISNRQVKDKILGSVDHIASMAGITVTGGRLNIFRALTLASPVIAVSPVSISFTLAADANSASNLSISKTSSNTMDLTWSLTSTGCSWLSFNKSSGIITGSTADQVQLTANAFGLNPGNYQCTINVNSNDATNPVIPVVINLEVLNDPPPQASVSPSSITNAISTGNQADNMLTVSNIAGAGSRNLHWSAATQLSSSWLLLSNNSGVTAPGTANQMHALSNAAGVSAGVYKDTINITTNDLVSPLVRIPVQLTVSTVAVTGQKMYLFSIDPEVIYRANLDGSNVATPFVGVGRPIDGAVDEVHRKLYFIDWSPAFQIFRADLDGANKELLFTNSLPDFGTVAAIALDVPNNHMFFIQQLSATAYRFSRADMDGGNLILLGDIAGWNFNSLRLDPVQQKLYWTMLDNDQNTSPLAGVWRSNLDLSQQEQLTFGGGNHGRTMVIDITHRNIYYSIDETIYKATIDGLNPTTVFTAPVGGDMEIDPVGGKLYWSRQIVTGDFPFGDWDISYTTERANLDGTNLQSLGVSSWRIALDLSPLVTTVPVTVNTSPATRSFTVDGTTYTSSQVLQWTPGTNHIIATTSPQSPVAGTQYLFNNWSDAGAISHSVIAPASASTFTANFTTQYQLTTVATPEGGGTITPISGFYNEGNIPVTAFASPNYYFTGFSNALGGTTNPQTINLNGPKTVTATFAACNLSITTTTAVGGQIGASYNLAFSQTGAGTPVYSNPGGNLPPGLGLSPSGVLSGTPTTAGSYTFNVRLTDAAHDECTVTASFTIDVCPVVTVNAVGSQSVCNGLFTDAIAFTGSPATAAYSWTNDNPSIGLVSSGTGDIPSFKVINTGNSPLTANIKVTASNTVGSNACTGNTINFSITVKPTPQATATPSSQAVCSGTSLTAIALTGNVNGTVSNWTSDMPATVTGIDLNGAGDINGAFINTLNTPVTVTFTIIPTADGCQGPSVQSTVKVNPLPAATISGTTAVCQAATKPGISFNGSGGTAPYIFTYSLSDGATLKTPLTATDGPSANVPAPTDLAGIFTYTLLSVQDAGSSACIQYISDQTVIVTVNPLPDAGIITASQVTAVSMGNKACVADAGTGATYTWTIGGGTISGGNGTRMITYKAGSSGLVSLSVMVTSGSNCGPVTGTKQVTITPLPCPNPAMTVASAVCTSSPGNIANVADAGTGATYVWTVSGGTITGGIGTKSVTYKAGAGDSHPDYDDDDYLKLSVKVTNASGVCAVNSGTYKVFISPLPNAAITTAASVCTSSAGNTASVSNCGAGSVYVWTLSNGGNITAGSGTSKITYTAPANGSATISVKVTNPTGCIATANRLVTIAAYPVAAISTGSSVCAGSTGNKASVASAGTGARYVWTITNGIIITGSTTNSITYKAGVSGSVTLAVKLTNSGGCTVSSTNKLVAITALPNASISTALSVCAGSANTASVASGASGYSWTISNGTISGSKTSSSINYVAGGSGTVTLFVTVTNSSGCKTTGMNSISVKSLPTATITALSSVCTGSTGNAASVASAGSGATYAWIISSGSSITSGNGTSSIKYTAATNGSVTLGVTVTNSGSCKATGSKTVAITSKITPVFTTIGTLCQNSRAPSLPTTSNNGVKGTWSPSVISTSSSGSRTYTFTPTSGQCALSAARSITVQKCSSAAAAFESVRQAPNLEAWISPNPSTTEFTLKLKGNSNDPVEIRVMDLAGRSLHYAKGSVNKTYKFGNRFAGGMYIVEILQGRMVKTIKIVKGN